MKIPTDPAFAVKEDPEPVMRTALLPALVVPPADPINRLPLETVPPLVMMSLLPELPVIVSAPMERALLSARELVRVPPLTMSVLFEELEVRPREILSRATPPPLVRIRVAPELVSPTLSRPVVPPLKLPAMTRPPFSTVVMPAKVELLAKVAVPLPMKERLPAEPEITLERVVLSERL